jgi:hypothetical protein
MKKGEKKTEEQEKINLQFITHRDIQYISIKIVDKFNRKIFVANNSKNIL